MASWGASQPPWTSAYTSGYAPTPQPSFAGQPPAYGGQYYGPGAWPRPYDAPTAGKHPAPRSSKYPELNPMLAEDVTMLRVDLRHKPRSEVLAATYYTTPRAPAMSNHASTLRLVAHDFPWTIDIVMQMPVTCEAVWDALYSALQEPLADSEWGLIVGDKKVRKRVQDAAKKRIDAGDKDKALRRIDFLGDTIFFKGLGKDEEFVKLRLFPGTKDVPATWVVKLGS
ncbi:uncharacterized protein SCHCODRAFT_02633946 [Schizophyllum commune H4-8]|uniref:uncharacterized protein n=1 Tax=Schizophyllum commune (strain H4-8 / FGSC 9210) TaxID=578458 RepID=UPI00215F5486|nr:uncharacterized protein SCHCODRAFT_02633946 [Schizophyllum commune H4-8]KAI5889237.1 hypothetical protein SCHCODRAFT_02633946 [Schizophyllum commune H4-8]